MISISRHASRPSRLAIAMLMITVSQTATAIGPAHRLDDDAVSLRHAPHRPGELIVKYRLGKRADSDAMHAFKAAHGLRSTGVMFDGRYERLRLPSALDVSGAIAMLSADPAIEYAEPNFLRRRHAVTPNDPLFPRQWGLLNSGQANFVSGGPAGTPGADINAANAWDLDNNGIPDRTGRGLVTIAVIDDAFDVDHPDLAANMVPGFDFVDDDSNPRPTAEGESHGTAVAGAAAAVGGNGIGIAGAAWNERIMPLRFGFDVASQIAAFDFARLNGARVINASYGGPGYSQAEVDAIAALDRAGILFVASAGNQDSNLDFSGATYPANYRLPNVIAVAATNRQDGVASFSTHGPVTVPLAAPGLQIVTTVPGGGYTSTNGVNGTSFSAPYVAGIAALVRDYIPGASVAEVKARLINAGEPGLDAANPVNLRTAGGRLNAETALAQTPGPAIVIRPQASSSYALTFASGTVNVPVQEAVVVEDGGNGRLDPGESADLRITLENLWLSASNVRARLTASGGATAGGDVNIGTLASGASTTVRFPVTVSPTLSGYGQIAFTLSITADNGYSATRRFLLDIGRLDAGVTVSQRFQSGLYDEFHTWVIDVPSSGRQLTVQSDGANDVDIFVRYGEPAQYSIDLDADIALSEGDSEPFYFVNVPDAQRGDRSLDGDETVTIPNTRAGSYYITVVNFDREPNALYTLRASLSGGSLPGPDPGVPGGDSSGSGGGGAGAPWLLALLAMMAPGRRQRRRSARLDNTRLRGLPEVPKAC